MTDGEADEVLHTAMTVGATRMQVMLTQEKAKLGWTDAVPAAETADESARRPPDGAAARAFAAAEVVEQADGG